MTSLRNRLRVFLAAMFVTVLSSAALADVWRLDPQHTEVRFSWNHLGVSRQSGEIIDLYGKLEFSPTAPEQGRIEVTLLLAGLQTGVSALDDMLKSPDYFDADRFPRITFKSVAVRASGDRSGLLEGDLTIRDITKRVVLSAVWNFTGEHPLGPYNPVHRGQWLSGFTAKGTINRSAFGITRAAPLVSDEIEITINAEFIRVD